MTLTESLISSFILVGLATQTGHLFGDSIQALGKSRLSDNINAAIHRDIEDVRQLVSTWKADALITTNGQLAYWPDETQCDYGTLTKALLSENTLSLPSSSTLDLSNASTTLRGIEVTRTIGTVVGNTNLIQVNYSTNSNSSLKTEVSTTLAIPAQGWRPT